MASCLSKQKTLVLNQLLSVEDDATSFFVQSFFDTTSNWRINIPSAISKKSQSYQGTLTVATCSSNGCIWHFLHPPTKFLLISNTDTGTLLMTHPPLGQVIFKILVNFQYNRTKSYQQIGRNGHLFVMHPWTNSQYPHYGCWDNSRLTTNILCILCYQWGLHLKVFFLG